MEVNFKANLLSKTYVRKLDPIKNKFVPHEVSFLEINSREKRELKAIKRLGCLWNSEEDFATKIFRKAKSDPRLRTFVLTTQQENFDTVDETKILGITQLSKENPEQYCIEYLETDPRQQYTNKDREFKKVGRRILHSLKKAFYDKSIRVKYLMERTSFYYDNGFEFVDDFFGDLVWNAQKKN